MLLRRVVPAVNRSLVLLLVTCSSSALAGVSLVALPL